MFKSIISLTLLAASAFAQNINIALPLKGAVVHSDKSFVVTLNKADVATSSSEVVVVIGLQSCATRACLAPSENLGPILYNGPFNPKDHEGGVPPHQNFTFNIPKDFPTGKAQLGVVHLNLIGGGNAPNYQTLKQPITIA